MYNRIRLTKRHIPLIFILLLSAVLNFVNLGIEGYGNIFYAAGVKSMMLNLKNFFFASFDTAGFVTIDKPPVGFWIQTISAKIFGFSGWSIILPQALAGIISVVVIYHIVKRSFGNTAGLIAALCLAITPISVAAGRNNTIDNLLVLPMLLACWAALIAAERGKIKYLILSLVMVGIGFNIKMVEAYMVAPAIYITYLLTSSMSFKKKMRDLIVGTLVLLVVSLSWAVIVDLVPASQRPYIGSSTNNTVMQLIIGHNGLERIGIGGRNGQMNDNFRKRNRLDQENNFGGSGNSNLSVSFKRANRYGSGNNFRSGSNFENRANEAYSRNSQSGIFRLFGSGNMSDQISWILMLAIIGFIAAAVKEKLKAPFNNRRKLSLILWVAWLLPEFIYFSFSKNITHTYYLTTMAPSIAALAGIGLFEMWEFYKSDSNKSWILPTALILNGFIEIIILSHNGKSAGYRIIIILTAILCIVSSIVLCIINLSKRYKNKIVISRTFAAVAFAGILVAPAVWSFTPMFYKMNGSSPSAGLELSRSNSRSSIGMYNNESSGNNSKLISFLEKNYKEEKYLVAVPSATSYGSELILETGKSVMALGGFSGSDPILTLKQFKQLVNNGDVRYAIVNITSGRINSPNNNIVNWIRKSGTIVPESEWKDSTSSMQQTANQSSVSGFGISRGVNSTELYDLKSAHS
ncbi:ArnT family glycosyltransferase [Clostridium tyrobutyricum]|uniref:Putative glycosyltransferase n=1 Tax=Clostridium tyrobutyricum TaxID=1519 RepID=A0A0A7HFN7_CLOTY|nr:glycosyltransferase family 39 protein [Clostridium tyrobutyricum]AIZ03684.1 putative glycosyltransferase [Clostridium tyrobutyricum]MBV4415477.1 glycosyltransferase family 39 protein [Clostridium tyrobutyricum]MBV4421435.1 glycosyltransferase family 39 protein [Clostridium tyrobutyricum]